MGLEHDTSIASIVQLDAFGSAAALLRPLLEATAAPRWLTYAATDEAILGLQIAPAESHLDDLPLLGDMGKDLQTHFPPIAKIVEGFAKKGSRTSTWLHQYTHRGARQLLRRRPAGFWTNADVSLTLVRVYIFGLAAAAVDLARADNTRQAGYLYPRRDERADDLHDIVGAEKIAP